MTEPTYTSINDFVYFLQGLLEGTYPGVTFQGHTRPRRHYFGFEFKIRADLPYISLFLRLAVGRINITLGCEPHHHDTTLLKLLEDLPIESHALVQEALDSVYAEVCLVQSGKPFFYRGVQGDARWRAALEKRSHELGCKLVFRASHEYILVREYPGLRWESGDKVSLNVEAVWGEPLHHRHTRYPNVVTSSQDARILAKLWRDTTDILELHERLEVTEPLPLPPGSEYGNYQS